MIPNLLNTLLGLWLVYAAILRPTWTASSLDLATAAIVVFVLALWARPGDYGKWQSSTNIVLGILLLLFAGVQRAGLSPPLLTFWAAFWVGMLVAVFALWAALYRPPVEASPLT